jgi:glutamate/tyrosine decarboxylase-like PLP-dependent enzyme
VPDSTRPVSRRRPGSHASEGGNRRPRHRARRGVLVGADGRLTRRNSWATDAHKWLNAPYDCGLASVADRQSHLGAMGVQASYLVQGGPVPDQFALVPEFLRRARGFPVYAALRSLGRRGVADLIERCCAHARRFADGTAKIPRPRTCSTSCSTRYS